MDNKKDWLNIEAKFREDINASVICPKCNKGLLVAKDIAFDDSNLDKGGERIISCPVCNKFEAVLYRVNFPQNWNPNS